MHDLFYEHVTDTEDFRYLSHLGSDSAPAAMEDVRKRKLDAEWLWEDVTRPKPDAEWVWEDVTRRKLDFEWVYEAELQFLAKRHLLGMRSEDWMSRHARLQDLLGSENKWVRAIGRYVTLHLGPDELLYSRMEVRFVKTSEVLVLQDI